MNLVFLLLARYYWPVSVALLSSGSFKHTHVQVTGIVAYAVTEDDGDLHIKLTSVTPDTLNRFIIAECIPSLPCRHPKSGDTVTVRGISRYDPEHRWYEVHPVEQLLP